MNLKRIVAVSFIPAALIAIVALLFLAVPVPLVYGKGDGPPTWYFKAGGWPDYAPSGVPDFDQKQNGATNGWTNPGTGMWSYCGPVAVANSLWWFDSKYESSTTPPQGPPYPSPDNGNYDLITSYGGWPPSWDDHDPVNVGGMAGSGLVDDLAWYMDTDGIRTGLLHAGTEVHEMSYGLQWYLYGGNPAWLQPPYNPPLYPSPPFGQRFVSYYDDYHVQLVKMPTWDWVVEEVERSEDVVLLLGFWEED
jgi:hypothetical protein